MTNEELTGFLIVAFGIIGVPSDAVRALLGIGMVGYLSMKVLGWVK
jgi:hypothetical protein